MLPGIGDVELPENAVIDPVVRSQADIGLKAELEGNKLRISVRNKTKRDLIVGPKNLALLLFDTEEPIPFRDNEPGFPVTTLSPDEEQVGLVPLRELFGRLTGARLLFSHPDCRPAFTPVE